LNEDLNCEEKAKREIYDEKSGKKN